VGLTGALKSACGRQPPAHASGRRWPALAFSPADLKLRPSSRSAA